MTIGCILGNAKAGSGTEVLFGISSGLSEDGDSIVGCSGTGDAADAGFVRPDSVAI
jgi:hypothetical protein